MALYPDIDTPFQDERDVVDRLLPYHVFQIPGLETGCSSAGKGKMKADEHELRNAIQGI